MQTSLQLQREMIDGYPVVLRRTNYQKDKQHVILVHGIGVSSRYFLPLAEELAVDYNVTTLDLPGYGASPRPPRPLKVKELALVIEALIIKYDLSPCILIGHSMGTQIVAHVARHSPELVSKIILLAPTVYRRERSVIVQSTRLLQDAVYESPRVNCIIFSDYMRMGILRYLRTASWMVRDYIEETLRTVHIPILMVRGTKDKIVPQTWIDFLKATFPKMLVKEVANAPHALQFKYPKETAAICHEFINLKKEP